MEPLRRESPSEPESEGRFDDEVGGTTLDPETVLRHLESGFEDDSSGDALAGIRNGILIALGLWAVIVAALVLLT